MQTDVSFLPSDRNIKILWLHLSNQMWKKQTVFSVNRLLLDYKPPNNVSAIASYLYNSIRYRKPDYATKLFPKESKKSFVWRKMVIIIA